MQCVVLFYTQTILSIVLPEALSAWEERNVSHSIWLFLSYGSTAAKGALYEKR